MEITEIGLLAVKKETTYGTDPVPTAALNTIPCHRDQVTYSVSSTDVGRKLLDGSLDALPGFNAMPNVTMKFNYEIRGNYIDGANNLDISNGNIAQALEIDALLQAANLAATYTAAGTPGVQGSSAGTRDGFVTYQPFVPSTQGPSVTLYFWTQLKLHKLIGGKVDFDIVWEAGKPAYIAFTIQGKYAAVTDATFPTTAAFIAVKPPLFDNTATAIGGYNASVFSQLKISLGNKITQRTSAVDVDSIAGFVISSFDPKGTVDPESVAEATNPFWADWKAAVVKSLVCGPLGTQSGNKLTGTFGAQYTSVTYGDRNGVRIHSAAFNIVKTDLTAAIGSQFKLKFG